MAYLEVYCCPRATGDVDVESLAVDLMAGRGGLVVVHPCDFGPVVSPGRSVVVQLYQETGNASALLIEAHGDVTVVPASTDVLRDVVPTGKRRSRHSISFDSLCTCNRPERMRLYRGETRRRNSGACSRFTSRLQRLHRKYRPPVNRPYRSNSGNGPSNSCVRTVGRRSSAGVESIVPPSEPRHGARVSAVGRPVLARRRSRYRGRPDACACSRPSVRSSPSPDRCSCARRHRRGRSVQTG